MNITNTAELTRNPSVDIKMDAIHRCFELGESVKSVSEDIGYSRASIYQWHKRYLRGGAIALMNNKNISPGQLKKGMETPSSDQDIRQLQEQVNDLQMEIDILKETINVLKKDPGVNQTALRNREYECQLESEPRARLILSHLCSFESEPPKHRSSNDPDGRSPRSYQGHRI